MPSRWKCASYSHSKQPQKSQDFKRILITVFVFTSAHRHNSHRRLMRSGCQDRLRLLSKTSHLSTFTSFTSFTTAHTGRARENFMRLITMHPPLRMRPRRSACARSSLARPALAGSRNGQDGKLHSSAARHRIAPVLWPRQDIHQSKGICYHPPVFAVRRARQLPVPRSGARHRWNPTKHSVLN
jgi:hypothetical protein